jgi:hypothetical protein
MDHEVLRTGREESREEVSGLKCVQHYSMRHLESSKKFRVTATSSR